MNSMLRPMALSSLSIKFVQPIYTIQLTYSLFMTNKRSKLIFSLIDINLIVCSRELLAQPTCNVYCASWTLHLLCVML